MIHPIHGRIQVRLRGSCPVLPIGQALSLIAELEQARMDQFEKTVEDLKSQMKVLRDQGRDGWTWERHLQARREDGDRTSMAGCVHRCPAFAALSPEALLGLPEAIPRTAKDGWNMLKGLPWSRAKWKALFQSDGWIVNLFSGDDRTREARTQAVMKQSLWSTALEGNDVFVNVDVTASKSLDLRQQGAVFRLLSGGLNGKIKAIIGGPPRHSYPRCQGVPVDGGQALKEDQLLVRMLSLWYMAEEGRTFAWRQGSLKSPPLKPHVGFMLEHPDSGEVSNGLFFQTTMWKVFAQEELMGEIPCVINGRPTVLAGNLDLWHLRDSHFGALEAKDAYSSVWPMELVAHLAGALRSWRGLRNREGLLASLMRTMPRSSEENVGDLAKFDAAEWKLHLQRDHLPYRRDCRVCVERSTGKPHKRISHPSAYVLSIDTAGPFRHKALGGYKYLLVACYRFPQLPGTKEEAEGPDEAKVDKPLAAPEDGGDWIFDEEEPSPEVDMALLPEDAHVDATPEDLKDEADRKDEAVEGLKDLAEPLKFSSVYIVRPMKSRKHAETLRALQEAYIQLRSCGLFRSTRSTPTGRGSITPRCWIYGPQAGT